MDDLKTMSATQGKFPAEMIVLLNVPVTLSIRWNA